MKTLRQRLRTTGVIVVLCAGNFAAWGDGEPTITFSGVPPDQEVPCGSVPAPAHVTVSGGCFAATSSDGLLLHYTFNNPENLGFDSSGRGNHGLAVGPMADADGVEAGACRFTGGGQIWAGDLGDAEGRLQMSWGAWVKPDPGSGLYGVMGKTMDYDESFYLLLTPENQGASSYVVTESRVEERYADAAGLVSAGQWHHVMGTYDGRTIRLYVDGSLAAEQTHTAEEGLRSNDVVFVLGDVANNRGWRFRGLMDEARIYDRVLSAEEIDTLVKEQRGALVLFSETTNGVCPAVLERVWSAEDSCGQSASVTQHISVVDTVGPVLVGVPGHASIRCGLEVPPADVTAFDACSGATVEVTLSQETNGVCPATIVRIWTATDACGNASSATQTVSIVEAGALQFVGVPEDLVTDCGSVPPPAPVVATGGCLSSPSSEGLLLHYTFDNPGQPGWDASGSGHHGVVNGPASVTGGVAGGACRFTGWGDISVDDFSGVNGSTQLTWGAWVKPDPGSGLYGIMGKTESRDENHYLLLVPGAQLASAYVVPESRSEERYAQTNGIIQAGVWQHVMGTYDGRSVKLYLDGQLVSEQTYVNAEGIRSNQVIFSVGDVAHNRGWRYRGLMDDVRVYGRVMSAEEIFALASGQGGGSLQLSENVSGACPAILQRVWTATDRCGNSGAATQMITLVDLEGPVLVGVPPDAVVNCASVPGPAAVTALDGCQGSVPTVLVSDSTNGACPATIVRIWEAVDACGNTTRATQTLVAVETGGIALLGIPSDMEIACDGAIPPAAVTVSGGCRPVVSEEGLLLHYKFDNASDLGADASGLGHHGQTNGQTFEANGIVNGACRFTGGSPIVADTLPELGATTQLTWGAWVRPDPGSGLYGIMGKTYSMNESFFLMLVPAAELARAYVVPASRSEERYAETSGVVQAGAWRHVLGTYDGRTVRLYVDGVLEAEQSYTNSEAMQSNNVAFTVGDVAPARGWRFQGLMDDVRVYRRVLSDQEIADLAESEVQAVLTMEQTTNGTCPEVITRIWTAQDDCGNQNSATQRISRVDRLAPVLSGVPADREAYCGDLVELPVVEALDGCAGAVTVGLIEVTSPGCPAVLTRTWSAEDACGNHTSAVQVVHLIKDERDPDGDGLVNADEHAHGTDRADADSDDDGLSDREEVTGLNDPATACAPNGMITDPRKADTDGDGAGDCEESIVGTDPTADDGGLLMNASVVRNQGELDICWPSISNRTYSIVSKTDLLDPGFPQALATNLVATPPENCHTVPAPGEDHLFIRVRVEK